MSFEQTQVKISLGTKIRNRRLTLGLSQQEIVAGSYSEAYLSRVEHNQILPSDQFLAHLAAHLNTSVAELVSDTLILSPKQKKASREAQEAYLSKSRLVLMSGMPAEAREIIEKLELGQLSNDLKAHYFTLSGEIDESVEDYNNALTNYRKALEIYELSPKFNILDVEEIRNRIGLVFKNQNKYFLAIEQHQLCLQAVNEGKINSPRFCLEIYRNLANEYHQIGNHQQALTYYQEAISLGRLEGEFKVLAEIYLEVGRVYLGTNNIELAKQNLNESAAVFGQIGDLHSASRVQGVLGKGLIDYKEFQQAEKILLQALGIAEKLDDTTALNSCYTNLAYLYLIQGKMEEAAKNANLGVENARRLADSLMLGHALAQLADIKLAQKSSKDGLLLYEEAVKTLDEASAVEELSQVCFRYASELEKMGLLQESIKLYRKAYRFKTQKAARS